MDIPSLMIFSKSDATFWLLPLAAMAGELVPTMMSPPSDDGDFGGG